jgi:phosphate transport system substrate-binding protein
MNKLLMGAALLLGTVASAQGLLINGAGATFPAPLYQKWFSEYNKINPNIKFNYQPIGSGGGIKQFSEGTIDFGASDAFMKDDQIAKAPDVVHIPTVLGAVVVAYNVPGLSSVHLSGETLAGIFLGKITKWNDPAITKLNEGVQLPSSDITVVHRSDGSGTTYIFVDYLAKVSPEWKSKVGVGQSVNWPSGVGGKGNEGVAGLVSQTPGSIGYVELIYALQNKIAYGSVQNMAGEFITASEQAVTAAAASAAGKMPPDFRVSITNAPGKGVYPIASFTWLLLYENPKDKAQSKIMVDFMKWMLADGQKFAGQLGYAPLPDEVVKLELVALQKIKVS